MTPSQKKQNIQSQSGQSESISKRILNLKMVAKIFLWYKFEN